MSYLADSTYAIYVEKVRRAAKEHLCCACKLPIRPGDFYAYVTTVAEGEVATYKRCGACQLTHKHLRELCEGDQWPDERLGCGQKYEEEWGEDPPDSIQALPLLSAEERGQLLRKDKT